jgi:hypothetical protein
VQEDGVEIDCRLAAGLSTRLSAVDLHGVGGVGRALAVPSGLVAEEPELHAAEDLDPSRRAGRVDVPGCVSAGRGLEHPVVELGDLLLALHALGVAVRVAGLGQDLLVHGFSLLVEAKTAEAREATASSARRQRARAELVDAFVRREVVVTALGYAVTRLLVTTAPRGSGCS